MAILHCCHCGSDIDSDARRTQCRECRALFPFECAICAQKLRSPFPVFDDERHLTLGEAPQPLCDEHFLRKCPDCARWFSNDENPGFFRCLDCAARAQNAASHPEWSDAPAETYSETNIYSETESAGSLPRAISGRPMSGRPGVDANVLAIGGAGCALLALLGWFLLGR